MITFCSQAIPFFSELMIMIMIMFMIKLRFWSVIPGAVVFASSLLKRQRRERVVSP